MSIVKKYQAEIIRVIAHLDGAHTLEMKSLGRNFKYSPGQFLHLALDEYDPSAGWPESRCFSIQSKPESDILKITYSVKGVFTKKMAELIEPGRIVQIKMPYGNLLEQEHNKNHTVFIAGGTGITPFLSLFNHSSFKDYLNPVLYFGTKTEKHNFFEKELQEALKINPGFKIVHIVEKTSGFINIGSVLNQNPGASFFISGPPIMIKDFKKYLEQNGVETNNILTDDWE